VEGLTGELKQKKSSKAEKTANDEWTEYKSSQRDSALT
jgi:hypothetical protein